MTRLLRVELARFVARRAVLVLLGLAILIPGVIGVATVINTEPPPADKLARAEARAEREAEKPRSQRQLQRCIDTPEEWGVNPEIDDVEDVCAEQVLPRADWYVYWDELALEEEREEGSGFVVVLVLAVLMLIAGTTFAGHDWASGSVSNQLLFEPRRVRVWTAKAVVVTAVAGALTAAVVTAYWLLLAAVVRSRDIAVPDGLLLDCLQSGWRGAGVAAAAGLAGYALTMLFRSTVAALGILLAVCVTGGVVLAVIGIDSVWNPGLNLAAIILDGTTYWAEVPCGTQGDVGMCEVEKELRIGRALAFVVPVLAAACAASLASFWRRDVG
ncbi:hypothetical protein HNR19_002417 [Nocardioides thalensis]|uniref:ABC transporter permease n=1 Tax=Nocardioides thalensis TaxID=1914755 RepID=A0A853C325_9ACTN|nr:hypothetical protein [Nocardioides thalensis]NYJ01719.1 hypothetical protein [Nocardioides thalensis]